MTPILGLDNRSSHSHGYGHKWGPLDRGVITTNSLQVWERHVGGVLHSRETRDLQENAAAAPGGTMGGTRRVCVSKNRGTDARKVRPPGGGTPAIGATNCQGLAAHRPLYRQPQLCIASCWNSDGLPPLSSSLSPMTSGPKVSPTPKASFLLVEWQ